MEKKTVEQAAKEWRHKNSEFVPDTQSESLLEESFLAGASYVTTPASPTMEWVKELQQLFTQYDRGFSEYFMQHNYRELYGLWGAFKETAINRLSSPSAPVQEGERYLPPDHGEICWQIGSETFTRKEVADMLHTQRSMIANDIKRECNIDGQDILLDILKNPRVPKF